MFQRHRFPRSHFGILSLASSFSLAALLLTAAHAQTYTAGAGLKLTGNQFSIANGGVTGAMIGLPLALSASSSSPILTVTNTGSGYGIKTVSTTGTGTYGTNTKYGNVGTLGDINGFGVYGSTAAGPYPYGVYGINRTSGNGDYGFLGGNELYTGNNYPVGVYGSDSTTSGGGYGVFGLSSKGRGVRGVGEGSGQPGVEGDNSSFGGVLGVSATGFGVEGYVNGSGTGVEAYSSGGLAGFFAGNVQVSGTLSAGAKNFKIDHPLDPTAKYLVHASIESDKMEDIYDGGVTTDANGNATVTMPAWFDALNTDCHYQLTCIGQFAQAIVASKVKNNQFTIKTDKPNVEVSWQVTGVRHDAFALAHPMEVEPDKPEKEKGLYQNPNAFGQPDSMGIGYQQLQKR